MNVILYMAITVNGYIAKENGDSSWVSSYDVDHFTKICKQSGVIIMGRRTYPVLSEEHLPFDSVKHIVLTRNQNVQNQKKNVFYTSKKPKEIIQDLKRDGYKQVVIIGGSSTGTAFLQENLIDEIYLDIEPLLFGKGIQLLQTSNLEYKLELISNNRIGGDTIQVHYRVIK